MGLRAAFGLLMLGMSLAVYLGVGSGAGTNRVYAMPVSEVNHLIDEIDLPEIIFANHKARHWRENDKRSVWALQNDAGKETFRLTATTAADKKGSLVTVAILPPDNDKRDETRVGFMALDVSVVEGLDTAGAASLRLRVPSTSLNELKIHQIRKILRDHPGDSAVYLHIGHGKILRLADEFCVDLDRAVGELRMLLGHDAVML